jgi:hypothetical protein
MNCQYCGNIHENQKCSMVKSIEYFEDGSVKKVEFFSWADNYVPAPLIQPLPVIPQYPWYGGAVAYAHGCEN